jgi:hypothetical protein
MLNKKGGVRGTVGSLSSLKIEPTIHPPFYHYNQNIMIKIVFKIVFTNQSIQYQVPGHWTTEYFFYRIRDILAEDLDIPNTYHIVPGPGLSSHRGIPEEAPPVELRSDILLSDYCNTKELNSFYIRFLDEPETIANEILTNQGQFP